MATKRLLAQPRLALLTVLGTAVGTGLVFSIPLYADADYYRMLNAAVGATDSAGGATVERLPYAFMFRYIGGWHGAVRWSEVGPVDEYLAARAAPILGLAQTHAVRFFRTDLFSLYPGSDRGSYTGRDALGWVGIGTIGDLQSHLQVTEGALPSSSVATGPLDVLVTQRLATELGIQPGDLYLAYSDGAGRGRAPVEIPLRVAGVWAPRAPSDEFWHYNAQVLSDLVLVPEETYFRRVAALLDRPVFAALWYLVFDGASVRAGDARPLLGRIGALQKQAFALLPNTTLDISLVEALQRYVRSSDLLTLLLFAFSVPVLGLVFAFIVLTVNLAVSQRCQEVAVLRSRGGTKLQVAAIAAAEAILLSAVAVLLAWPLGEYFARVMGRAQSFLNFEAAGELSVRMTPAVLRFGVVAAVVAVAAELIATGEVARKTIVAYKQERARALRRPWWQRNWLDVLLLAPAAYGIYLLRRQGSVVLPGGTGPSPRDFFENPLLFFIPVLAVFALTLMVLRLLPWIARLVSWLGVRTRSVGPLLAARQMARMPGMYSAPLILIVLTLSLAAFTASLAQTLDNQLYDQTDYAVGSDMAVVERGQRSAGAGTGGLSPASSAGGAEGESGQAGEKGALAQDQGSGWLFLPVSEYLKAPGVHAAARVGRYPASIALGAGRQQGQFMGVDPADFARVGFWRGDFAPQPLADLMNALIARPGGVLVPRSFLAEYSLSVGDRVRVNVDLDGEHRDLDLLIAGSFDLFPAWYAQDGPLFEGDLGYLFEHAGAQFPYGVWLKTDDCGTVSCVPADYEGIVRDVNASGIQVIQWQAALRQVAADQQRPERQGLFGLLSVGLLAAALLSVLGFLIYATFSLRQRMVELGVLRALGLSAAQMTALLASELAFLIVAGFAAGAAFGAWISRLFIPYLQVGSGAAAHTPPFVVQVAWDAIWRMSLLFGLLFVVTLGMLSLLLLRLRLFQTIKLGETV